MAQMVKNLPMMQETWVQSLGWEDPLEKGVETHSSILSFFFFFTPVFLPGEVHGQRSLGRKEAELNLKFSEQPNSKVFT